MLAPCFPKHQIIPRTWFISIAPKLGVLWGRSDHLADLDQREAKHGVQDGFWSLAFYAWWGPWGAMWELLLTIILGVLPGHLLQTCSSPTLSQKKLGKCQRLCDANCTHRFTPNTYGLDFSARWGKKVHKELI